MPCLARITSEDLRLPFGDGKHWFYMENVCRNGCDEDMCEKCSKKTDTNIQGSRRFKHGLVSGSYTSETHIFDSPWYKKALKSYGEPLPEILEKAMDAQKRSRAGKKVAPPIVQEPVLSEEKEEKPIKEKKSRGRPKKVIEIVQAPVVKEKIIQKVSKDALVESMDDPLEVTDVIQVILKRLKYSGTEYWHDADREKIYSKGVDGKKGAYVGRWTGTIIDKDIPDSDEENLVRSEPKELISDTIGEQSYTRRL